MDVRFEVLSHSGKRLDVFIKTANKGDIRRDNDTSVLGDPSRPLFNLVMSGVRLNQLPSRTFLISSCLICRILKSQANCLAIMIARWFIEKQFRERIYLKKLLQICLIYGQLLEKNRENEDQREIFWRDFRKLAETLKPKLITLFRLCQRQHRL